MADGWRMTGVLAAAAPLALAACVATPGCSKPAAPEGYEAVEIDGLIGWAEEHRARG